MKKLLAILISLAMLLSFAACSSNEKKPEAPEANEKGTTVVDDMNQPAADGEGPAVDMPAVDGETPAVDGGEAVDSSSVAQTLLNVFYNEMANPDISAEELANAIMADPVIAFSPMVMPTEEVFTGFNNIIEGYAEAVQFGPMIGTIPFVGYIFVLDDNTDVETFKATLEAEANLRWNICTAAEEMVCENVGNTVFFVMAPITLAE